MRKLLITLLLAFALSAPVLAENVTWEKTFTSAVPDSSALTLRSTGVYNHRLTWTGGGTRTTCSIKLEQSVDSSTWSDLIAAQTCTTDGAATTTGYANFVRISVTALTGSGNTVYSRYDGTPVASAGDTSALALESGGNLATLSGTIGTSTCYLTSAATTNATSCAGAAGKVYAIHVTNTSAAAAYLRLYNLATAPTCSSATGFIESIPVSAADTIHGVNGRVISNGQTYGTGIGYCLTGGGSSTDNTAVGTGIYVTILYK